MASLRTQTPEDNSRIQQLKVPMRKLRLAHRPFVLTIPDEKGTHFKVSIGRSKNRTVTGLAWKDGSFFRANFDLPPWAKDAAPPKDSNRIYVFKHGGGKSMGTGESEESGGSYTGVRIRIQDLPEFLAVFEKMVDELVTISRGKRGEVKAANKADKEAENNGGMAPEGEEAEAETAMKEAAFPIVGVPLNENIIYEDAYTEEIDYNGSGPGQYLAVRTSGGREKAVVEMFGPIPTRDRRGRELKIESLHLREGWQPIVKVEAKNRQEALSQAAQYFSNNGFEAERTYGTLHVHSPGVLSEGECLGKTEALVEAKSGKGISLFGKDLDHIDHGFYQISVADAKKACDGKLPGPGKEKLCVIDGQSYFVAKTPLNGKQVWSIRKSKWKPTAGGMKLGESRYYSSLLIEGKKGFQKGQKPFLKARSTGNYGEGEHFVIDLHDEHGRAVPLGGAFKKKGGYEDDSTGAFHKSMQDFKDYNLKRALKGEHGDTVKKSAELMKESLGIVSEAKISHMQSPDLEYEQKLTNYYLKGGKGRRPKVPEYLTRHGDDVLRGFEERAKIKAVDYLWEDLWKSVLAVLRKRETKGSGIVQMKRADSYTLKGLKALVKEAGKMEDRPESLNQALEQAKKFIAQFGDDLNIESVNEATEDGPRKISTIAREIKKYWPKPHYSAKPYLDAMMDMDTIDDMVLHETGKDIVTRFIGNASTWRGPDAKRIKAELKEMVGWNKK